MDEHPFRSANSRRDVIVSCREAMVNRLNVALQADSGCGDPNLVTFNANKTQVCLFSTKRRRIHLAPTFQGVSVPLTDSLQLLGELFYPTSTLGNISSPKH